MKLDRDTLLSPSFAEDPPVKLNVNARTLGLVIAILAGLGLLFELIGLLGLLSLGAAVAGTVFGGIVFLAVVGIVVDLAAAGLSLIGGWQMHQGRRDGKNLVIYGLVVGFIGEIVVGLGYASIANAFVGLIILAIVYYLVVISRFPDEHTDSATPVA